MQCYQHSYELSNVQECASPLPNASGVNSCLSPNFTIPIRPTQSHTSLQADVVGKCSWYWQDDFIFLPMDKSPNRGWLFCKHYIKKPCSTCTLTQNNSPSSMFPPLAQKPLNLP